MSIKNQKTLLITASGIIAFTVIVLFGLNFLVDKISKISPPSFVLAPPPPQAQKGIPGKDDSMEGSPLPPQMPPPGFPPASDDRFPPRKRGPDVRDRERPPMPPPDAMRRLRNGKDAPDLRRGQPPPPPPAKDDAADPGQKGRPPMPPNMGYPPSMDPSKMDPNQRQLFEEEMQRRQEMYYGGSPNEPPPGYYPPQMPPNYDYYDNGYDRGGAEPPPYDFEYDYEDYYYDPNSESNLKDPAKELEKTADIVDEIFEDDEYDPDYEEVDDYLHEYED